MWMCHFQDHKQLDDKNKTEEGETIGNDAGLSVAAATQIVAAGAAPAAQAAAPGGAAFASFLPASGQSGPRVAAGVSATQHPVVPRILKGLIFSDLDNIILQGLTVHQELRETIMQPYTVNGLGSHVARFGPLDACRVMEGDGRDEKWHSTLWPGELRVDAIVQELKGHAHANMPKVALPSAGLLESHLQIVSNASNPNDDTLAAPPCNVSSTMSTPFMMMSLIRMLQTRTAAALLTHSAKESQNCDTLVNGLQLELHALHRAVENAESYVRDADLEVAKLRAEGLGEADKKVADMVLPYIVEYKGIVENAKDVKSALLLACTLKLRHYLQSFIDESGKDFDVTTWKEIFGIPQLATRSSKKVKKIFKDEQRYKKLGPALKKLDQAIGAVAAFNGPLLRMDTALESAKAHSHMGSLYIAMIGILNNTIIKPAQGYPAESLKVEAKRCVHSLHSKYKVWLPRDDGRETITEDLLHNFDFPVFGEISKVGASSLCYCSVVLSCCSR